MTDRLVQSNYRIIAFGENEHGFFNNPVFYWQHAAAVAAWDEFYRDPEYSGAVMIETRHELWEVIKQFGTKNVSVVNELGNFKVLPEAAKTIQVPVATLEALIDSLDDAINVCCKVDSRSEDSEKSYPHATGYSRSAMIRVQEDVTP